MLKVSVHVPAAVGPRERMFCARTVLEVRYISLALDIDSTLDLRRFDRDKKSMARNQNRMILTRTKSRMGEKM